MLPVRPGIAEVHQALRRHVLLFLLPQRAAAVFLVKNGESPGFRGVESCFPQLLPHIGEEICERCHREIQLLPEGRQQRCQMGTVSEIVESIHGIPGIVEAVEIEDTHDLHRQRLIVLLQRRMLIFIQNTIIESLPDQRRGQFCVLRRLPGKSHQSRRQRPGGLINAVRQKMDLQLIVINVQKRIVLFQRLCIQLALQKAL